MDYDNPQFIAAIKKVLRQIVGKQTASKDNEHDADSEEGDSHTQPTDGVLARGDTADKRHTDDERHESETQVRQFFQKLRKNLWRDLNKPKTYMEFAALAFLVLYTCETKRTNNLTQIALSNSKEQFQQDQQPWVAGYQWELSSQPEENAKDVKVTIRVQNYGKTPALNVSAGGRPYLLRDGSQIPDDTGSQKLIRGVLPPGGTELPFYVIFSPEDVRDYMAEKLNVYVRARIEYCDTAGNLNWTNFCIRHDFGVKNLLEFKACGPGTVGFEKSSAHCPQR